MAASLIPAEDFPFCGPTNLMASPVQDAQRAINLFVDPGIASSKSRLGLKGRPGLASFSNPSAGTNSPVHSLWAGAGRLFASVGDHVYEINNAGGVITDYGGGIGSADANATPFQSNGVQLLVCSPTNGQVLNVNPVGPALNVVFNGSAIEYLDGFFISIAKGASLVGANPNQVNVSANGDGTTWPALSYFIETSAADLIVQLCVLNGLLYIFGQRTVRVWYDAGNAIQPLARVSGGVINVGCLASQSVVKFSNSIMWLGANDYGQPQVFQMQGMNPVPVSTPAIEFMIQNCHLFNANAYAASLSYSQAYAYQESGHTFYVLNIVNVAGGYLPVITLVYDLTTRMWHERTYGSAVPGCFANVQNFSAVGSPTMFVGDANSGKIYYQSDQYAADVAAAIIYTRIAPHTGSENRFFTYSRFELDIDPQVNSGAGTIAPVLDYSNNGGRSFLGFNFPLAQAANDSAPGAFQRFYANQLGHSRDRVFKVSITDSTNLIRIANAYLTAEADPT